jgi:acyl carrier protein
MAKQVEEVIKGVLLDLGIEENSIVDQAHIRNDLGLDSTELVDITLALKKEFDVAVKFQSMEDPTLEAIYQMVKHAQAQTEGSVL